MTHWKSKDCGAISEAQPVQTAAPASRAGQPFVPAAFRTVSFPHDMDVRCYYEPGGTGTCIGTAAAGKGPSQRGRTRLIAGQRASRSAVDIEAWVCPCRPLISQTGVNWR